MTTDNFNSDLLGAIKEADLSKLKQYLEQGANPNAADMLGDNALTWAVRSAMFADEHDQEAVRQRRAFGLQAIEILIAAKADINKPNNLGRTALFHAVQEQEADMVQALVTGGASALLSDCRGNSLNRYAELTKNKPIIDYIEKVIAVQSAEQQQRIKGQEARQSRQHSLRSFVRSRKM